jgi:hypothetical protein
MTEYAHELGARRSGMRRRNDVGDKGADRKTRGDGSAKAAKPTKEKPRNLTNA